MAGELIYKFVVDSVDVTEYVLAGTKIDLSKTNISGNTASITVVSDKDSICFVCPVIH